MSVRQLKENKITKDGRSWVFIQYSKGLDGKRHQYQSQAYMTEDEAIQAEKAYLNKYKDVEVNPHMTFKEAYTIYYDYQKDKIKDSTLKTYRDRIKYMGLLDNVELVNLNWDLYQKWRAQINKTNLCDRYKTDIQKFIKQVINFAEKQWDFNLRKFYNKLEPFKTPGALKKEMDFYRDKYAEKAGIRRIRLHDFRHSCASALISGAAPITAVSNFLGHSETTETLETYTHMFKKDLANVPKFFDTLEKDFNEKSSE